MSRVRRWFRLHFGRWHWHVLGDRQLGHKHVYIFRHREGWE